MHNACGKFVESLGKGLAQAWHKSGFYTVLFVQHSNKPLVVNNEYSVLYPETAINTQLKSIILPLKEVGFYTLYTGPINTTNLIKGIA